MARPLSPIAPELPKAEDIEAYDQWFHAKVEAALREADAPNADFVPHDQVMAGIDTLIENIRRKKSIGAAKS